jgi:hypothetical protein
MENQQCGKWVQTNELAKANPESIYLVPWQRDEVPLEL